MKGIILAAGNGTRLGPVTRGIGEAGYGVSKPLVATYDKPTIYYPLSDLISAGINDIMIIAAPDNVGQFKALLGDGSELGVTLTYAIQDKPKGIAEAFLIAEEFIGDDSVALVFGDNVFSGASFTQKIKASTDPAVATVFAIQVINPEAFGVVEFDSTTGAAISIEEKPEKPKSDYAIPGIYFYTSSVVDIARNVQPSARGELEISSVNEAYLESGELNVVRLDSDTNWFDTGTEDSLLEAANFVQDFQRRHKRLLGSPEAAAYLSGFIAREQLLALAEPLKKSKYGQELLRLANEGW